MSGADRGGVKRFKRLSQKRSGEPLCVYRVDADDRIVFADGGWDAFARRNAARHLVGPAVLGTLLWNHITGLENRILYQEVMDCVRQRGREIGLRFRCDGPRVTRRLSLRISPLPREGCEFRSYLLREARQPRVSILDPAQPKSALCVLMCNWCMMAEAQASVWQPVAKVIRDLHLRPGVPPPSPAFTICPRCLQGVRSLLD